MVNPGPGVVPAIQPANANPAFQPPANPPAPNAGGVQGGIFGAAVQFDMSVDDDADELVPMTFDAAVRPYNDYMYMSNHQVEELEEDEPPTDFALLPREPSLEADDEDESDEMGQDQTVVRVGDMTLQRRSKKRTRGDSLALDDDEDTDRNDVAKKRRLAKEQRVQLVESLVGYHRENQEAMAQGRLHPESLYRFNPQRGIYLGKRSTCILCTYTDEVTDGYNPQHIANLNEFIRSKRFDPPMEVGILVHFKYMEFSQPGQLVVTPEMATAHIKGNHKRCPIQAAINELRDLDQQIELEKNLVYQRDGRRRTVADDKGFKRLIQLRKERRDTDKHLIYLLKEEASAGRTPGGNGPHSGLGSFVNMPSTSLPVRQTVHKAYARHDLLPPSSSIKRFLM